MLRSRYTLPLLLVFGLVLVGIASASQANRVYLPVLASPPPTATAQPTPRPTVVPLPTPGPIDEPQLVCNQNRAELRLPEGYPLPGATYLVNWSFEGSRTSFRRPTLTDLAIDLYASTVGEIGPFKVSVTAIRLADSTPQFMPLECTGVAR